METSFFTSASSAGIRFSGRIQAQPNADDTQAVRAMSIAQQRDYQGTCSDPKLSIVSFPDKVISDRAGRLGVSLGKSPSDIAISIKRLKDTEKDRELTILNRDANILEDDPHNLFVSKVSVLCEDFTEEDAMCLDDHTDHICQEVKAKRTSIKKVVVDKSKGKRYLS
jgi:hypothetical protein